MDKLPDGKKSPKRCPKCAVDVGAVQLIVRTNRANGNQFLGCPRWPECDYTEPIPDCIKMRLAGAPELFGDGDGS